MAKAMSENGAVMYAYQVGSAHPISNATIAPVTVFAGAAGPAGESSLPATADAGVSVR